VSDRAKQTEKALKEAYLRRESPVLPEDFSSRVMAAVHDQHRQSQVVDFPAGDGGLWMFARFAAAAATMAIVFGYSQYAYGDLLPSIWSSDMIGLTSMMSGF